MAVTGPYQPVTFEANRAQRAKRLGIGILFLVIGVGGAALSGRVGSAKATAVVIVVGLVCVGLGVLALASRRGYTRIDDEGIYTSGVWGRRRCRWTDITDVELKIDADDGSPLVYSIKIHRRGGRSFTLAAPTDSSTKDKHDNPEFRGQLAVIQSYWRSAAGPEHEERAPS